MTISKLQVELKKGGYASILEGLIAPDKSKNWKKKWFSLSKLSLIEQISLKFNST